MSKKLTVLLATFGLQHWGEIPDRLVWPVVAYLIGQSVIDAVMAWKGVGKYAPEAPSGKPE